MSIHIELEKAVYKKIRKEIEKYTAKSLKPYLELLKRRGTLYEYATPKQFQDAVWGTVVVNVGETILVDSPIIQRLRYIKHLGLTNKLFYDAEASRFSHTLGVLSVADAYSNKILHELKNTDYKESKKYKMSQIARLGAIFHDTGHMFCSHASGRYYNDIFFSRFKEIRDIKTEFMPGMGITGDLDIAEFLSVLIVQSEAVKELLDFAMPYLDCVKETGQQMDSQTVADYISCLILGIGMDSYMLPFLHIVNGTIDSDKCDYLKRDSHFTGVPASVDILRLVQKIKILPEKEIKRTEAWVDEKTCDNPIYSMAEAYSAINTVDQLLIARTLMYDNVYYHQKVLEAETMLREAIHIFDSIGCSCFKKFDQILELTDQDIINPHCDVILGSLCKSIYSDKEKKQKFNYACRILKQIYYRRIYKHCLLLSSDGLIDITTNMNDEDDKKTNSTRVKEFIEDVIQNARGKISGIYTEKANPNTDYRTFLQRIQDEIFSLSTRADTEGKKLWDICKNDLKDVLISVKPPFSDAQINANLNIDVGGLSQNYSSFFQSGTWMSSRAKRRMQHFVIANEELLYVAFIATQKILLRDYGFLLAEDNYQHSKINKSLLDKYKEKLFDVGYYNDCYQLVPERCFLTENEADKLTKIVNDNWSTIQLNRGYRVNCIADVYAFLGQFIFLQLDTNKREKLLKGVISILENILVINRETRYEHFKVIIEAMIEREVPLEEIIMCKLGLTQDSGAIMGNEATDVIREKHMSIPPVCDSLNFIADRIIANDSEYINKPIVLLDDASYSMTQVLSIFEEYVTGISFEHHADKLTDEQLEVLAECKIILSFIYFKKDNVDILKQEIMKYGFNDVEVVYSHEFPQSIFDQENVFPNKEIAEITKECFQLIGEKLLSQKKKGVWDSEEIKKHALGYNEGRQVIVTDHNTPTYTLTPLWLSEEIDGFKWMPLFPRQSKQ